MNAPDGWGAWIYSPGSGAVIVENSEVLGNRVGTQWGGGIGVNSNSLSEIVFRNVTVADTVVHPLTTTTNGAGVVFAGRAPGGRLENSFIHSRQSFDRCALAESDGVCDCASNCLSVSTASQ